MMFGSQVPNPMVTQKKALQGEGITLGHREACGGAGLDGGQPHARQRIERFPAASLGHQPARRFRQAETQRKNDQSADANADPNRAPPNDIAEEQGQQGGHRPGECAADKVDEREDSSPQTLGRELTRVGKGEGLFGAEPDPGDKPDQCEP
jgi:hypothetical protein